MIDVVRLVVDLDINQVSVKISLMDISERQMSGKGCSVREGLSTLIPIDYPTVCSLILWNGFLQITLKLLDEW